MVTARPKSIDEIPVGTFWVIYTNTTRYEGATEYNSGRSYPDIEGHFLFEPEVVQRECERMTRAGLRFRCFKITGEVKTEVRVDVSL
jgi:hypothetical protein